MRMLIRFVLPALLVGASALQAQSSAASRRGRPASRPAWPDEHLQRACDETLRKLRARTGGKLEYRVDVPFVVAGDLPPAELDGIVRRTIRPAAAALWKKYFDQRPNQPITVLLFAEGDSYRAWAKTLFGDTSPPHFGYYRREIRTLVMNIRTGTGTLVHEMVHALAEPDFPDMPDWFSEGLASLYEQCTLADGDIRGLVNWRLPGLREAIGKNSLRSLKSLVTVDDFRGDREGLNYAQARYFCMYMEGSDRLVKFYKLFRDRRKQDATGMASIERVFDGRDIAAIERDYLAWLSRLPGE